MATTLPLQTMTIQEKIQAMEALWDSLCENAGAIAAPDWHGHVLDERVRAVQIGADQFEDWEEAKKAIRDELE